MMAGVELQQKLVRRLRLLGADEKPTVDGMSAEKKAVPTLVVGEKHAEDVELEEPSEEDRLRGQILKVRKERDEAVAKRLQIESDSVKRNKSSAEDIIRSRTKLEATRQSLDSTREEANWLRQKCHSEAKKKECVQEEVRKTSRCISSAKAEKNQLLHEIHEEKDKLDRLWEQVGLMEDRISDIVERKMLLQVQLSELTGKDVPRVQEVPRRSCDEPRGSADEPRGSSHEPQAAEVLRTFSLNSGSDDEGEPGPGAAEQQEAEAAEEEPPMGDLEFCYEGLELSNVMPIPQALRMASGHVEHQETIAAVPIVESGPLEREGVEFSRWTRPSPSGNKEWSEEELEAEYGEHIRNLQTLLEDLHREQAEAAEEQRCSVALAALKKQKREAAAAAGEKKGWFSMLWGTPQKETPACSTSSTVVSGFKNFSPYAAVARKYC